jgi:hypothetical protein
MNNIEGFRFEKMSGESFLLKDTLREFQESITSRTLKGNSYAPYIIRTNRIPEVA